MAKIFLDSNIVLDIAYRKPETRKQLDKHEVYLSIFSILILCYVGKIKIPSKKLSKFLEEYQIISLTNKLINKSITGPTTDIEDNIQLHSAAQADCEVFLTKDKKLLNMKFFGKTEIVSTI